MKKALTAALVVIVALTAVFTLSACVDGEEEVRIEALEARVSKNTIYKVGENFDRSSIAITAVFTNGTKKTVTSTDAIDYDTSNLMLRGGKFTEDGTFTLVIKYLRLEPVEVDIKVIK